MIRFFPRPIVYLFGGVTILTAASGSALAQAQSQEETPLAPTQPPPAPPPQWQQRIDEIDQRSRIAERRLELAAEAAEAKQKERPSLIADESGFGIKSGDGRYQIRLGGQVQIDGRRFFGDAGLQDRDTFLIRRARPTIDATVLGLVDLRLTPDFGGGTAVVVDAYLDAHPRAWLRLRAGKFKPPVGLERLQADTDLVFIERALDANLSAQRDVGLELWGDVAGGVVRYEAAILNGVPDNTQLDADSDHPKTFAGRIFIQPFNTDSLRWLGRLGVGVAGSTGNEKGSPALTAGAASNTWLPTFRSNGQNNIYAYLSSTTDLNATVFALKRHSRLNPQLYYYKGPFGLLAEWVKEYQEVGKGNDTGALNHTAGHVTVSVAYGGDVTYEGVKPHRPLDLAHGSLGAVEVGVRYNRLDLDDVGFPTLADPTRSVTKAQGWGLASNWYPSRNLRVSANYERTNFTGGVRNGDRTTEKVALGRFQINF
jgi:phosphate-selective porin OprO/OprP